MKNIIPVSKRRKTQKKRGGLLLHKGLLTIKKVMAQREWLISL